MSDEGYIAVKQSEDRNYGTVAMKDEEEQSPPAASEAASTTRHLRVLQLLVLERVLGLLNPEGRLLGQCWQRLAQIDPTGQARQRPVLVQPQGCLLWPLQLLWVAKNLGQQMSALVLVLADYSKKLQRNPPLLLEQLALVSLQAAIWMKWQERLMVVL